MNSKFLLCLALVLSGGLFADNCPAAIIYPKAPDGGRQMVIKFLDPSSLKILGVSNIDDLTIAGITWNADHGGIALPGKRYVVEVDLMIFESDILARHKGGPQWSENRKIPFRIGIIWQRTLGEVVK